MKLNKDWKAVFKRYSFIAHIFSAVSSTLLMALIPFVDYIPVWVSASIALVCALLGITGSFVKQQIEEDKNDNCKHNN